MINNDKFEAYEQIIKMKDLKIRKLELLIELLNRELKFVQQLMNESPINTKEEDENFL